MTQKRDKASTRQTPRQNQGRQRRDQIAREAARMIETGSAEDISEAIRRAADRIGYGDGTLPGAKRVRQHAQGMAMQALGREGYEARRHGIRQLAEEIMTTLEEGLPGVETLLMGRAALGHIDAGVTLQIRLYTRQSEAELAAALVAHGYEEPVFDTVDTSYGRVNRIRFVEDGIDVVLSICPPALRVAPETDMFTGKSVASLTLPALRRTLSLEQ